MSFSWIGVLSSIVLFQLSLLTLFLFFGRTGKRISNIILGSFFLWLIVNITDGLLLFSEFYERHPAWAHVEDGFILLLGPLLYFYARSMVYKDFRFKASDIGHALPFLVATLLFQVYYHVQAEADQRFIQEAIVRQDLPVQFYVIVAFVYAHIGLYLFLAWKELMTYRAGIKEKFSEVNAINLQWLEFMLLAVGIILFISLVLSFVPLVRQTGMKTEILIIPFAFIFIFCTVVFWKALRQPSLFAGLEIQENKKYQVSAVTPVERDALAQLLKLNMANDELFLDPDLTIDQLSDRLKSTPRKVSQVINEVFQQNFFDFINSYRIDKAKRILAESTDNRLTILEVMYQCGFNSKSSFNTVFRQKTGLTPSEFRKRNSARSN